MQIAVSGDTAIANYNATIIQTNCKGKRENSTERCAETLIKSAGQWRFLGWLCKTKNSSSDE